MGSKNFLDFVKGLAAEVRSLEQFVFGSLDQVADIVNVFGLEAVGRTNGKFEVVNRTTKNRINRRLRFSHRSFDRSLRLHAAESRLRSNGFKTDGGQTAEDGKLILENMGSLTQRFFRKNGAVRLNVHDEFVKVGALFDTCVFNT